MHTVTGTHHYMAPEVIRSLLENESGDDKYPVDAFSAGITLYQMLSSEAGKKWIPIEELFAAPADEYKGKPVGLVMWKRKNLDWNPIYLSQGDSDFIKAIKTLLIRMVKYKPIERQ